MKLNSIKQTSLKIKAYTKNRSLFLLFTNGTFFKGLKSKKLNFLAVKNSLLRLNLKLYVYKTIAPLISKTINLLDLNLQVTTYSIQKFAVHPKFVGLLLNKNFYNSFQLINLENFNYKLCNINFINTLKKSIVQFKVF